MVIFIIEIMAVRQVGFGQTVFEILCFDFQEGSHPHFGF